ncbi:AcrR family transcriptional regulator [Luteibacter sp. 621]|uniref:TetR/AcrR family transcriptional regulator n=1 Tax=Luteibacter sp. 621 TaxID=3373916 RepID=UPI003D20132B
MDDKRQQIIEAALTELREAGFAAFSQTKVAKRAGLRQSHLTYYYPTRADLVVAVAETAMTQQLAAVEALLAGTPPAKAPAQLATLLGRKENTRILMALVQGADEEPRLQPLFTEFARQMRERAAGLLGGAKPGKAPGTDAYLLHALCVGLAVLGLALDHGEDGQTHRLDVLKSAMKNLGSTNG